METIEAVRNTIIKRLKPKKNIRRIWNKNEFVGNLS